MDIKSLTAASRRSQGAIGAAGFSLLELIISISLLSMLLAAVFDAVWRVEKGYAHEKRVSAMQGNQRYAMEMITRALRNAGNNPEGIALDKVNLDPDGNGQKDSIRIQSDCNPPDGDIADSEEDVLFRVSSNSLLYRDGPPGSTETSIAANVQSISFAAFDDQGNPTTSVDLMSAIVITLTATTERRSLQTGTVRTQALTATVNLRM
jgi:prepilin-type N-terminal cleavage/methylation domain-containing protein